MGYVNGEWIYMYRSGEELVLDDDGGRHTYIYLVYLTDTEEEVRYTCIAESYVPPAVTPSNPGIPSDLSDQGYQYSDLEQNNDSPLIYSGDLTDRSYMGYINGEWVELDYSMGTEYDQETGSTYAIHILTYNGSDYATVRIGGQGSAAVPSG